MHDDLKCNGYIGLIKEIKPIIPYSRPSETGVIVEPFFLTDDLAYIGSVKVGCFAVKTDIGIILIDSFETPDAYPTLIQPALKKLGLGDEKILACFITHGHFDHHCGAGMLREMTGCKLIISTIDAQIMSEPDPRGTVHPYPSKIDRFCEDGDEFTFGDKTFFTILTPGHTPGCISLIFNTNVDGQKHTACIWGGTGLPNSLFACCDYLKSAAYFSQLCSSRGADIEISAHPFVDNMLERKTLLENRDKSVCNPFIIGTEGVAEFMYQRMASAMVEIAKYTNQMVDKK